MAESVGTVAGLWRYPVKSMGGEPLDACAAGERGLAGDRGWAVVDTETGRVASAKRPKLWGALLECAAEYAEEPEPGGPPARVRIRVPDRSVVDSDDPERDRLLSRALGRPVTLLSSAPEGATYEIRRADVHGLDAEAPEALTESRVGIFAPAGTFFDTSTLHVLTSATLARLAGAHREGRWDVRRFRPNVLVDLEDGDGTEDAWVGRSIGVGTDVGVAVLAPMPRCVMTTVAQGELPRDPLILRTVAQLNRREIEGFGTYACAGLLANVTSAGTVRVGEPVTVGDAL